MTLTEMQEKAKLAGGYASQLLALKECFGPDAKIGCLISPGNCKRVGTFTELNALGWAGPEANDIDNHRVPTIGEQRPDPVRTMKWIESLPTGK